MGKSPNEDYAQLFCYECKHFHMDLGCEDWSEITPGDPVSVGCYMGHWRLGEGDETKTFYKQIRLARSCPDFEVAEWI